MLKTTLQSILLGLMTHMHRYSLTLMIVSVILGLSFPVWANTYIVPLLPITIFFVILGTVVQIDLPKIVGGLKSKSPWVSAVWNTIVLTGIVFLIISAFDIPYALKLALLATVASAPILSSSTVAQILGLQAHTVLLSTMTSMLFMPISLYFAIFILMDNPLQLDLQAYCIRFAIYLILPVIISYGVQKYTPSDTLQTMRLRFRDLAVFLTIFFAVGIMGNYGLLLRHDMLWALTLLGYTVLLTGIMTLMTYWVYGLWADNETALSYVTAVTTRNSFLAWIVAGPYLGNQLLNLTGTHQIMMIVGMIGVKISQKYHRKKIITH